ncbi:hypothetical protein ACFLUQ_00030 [Chloroflexota bacterium]
MLSHEDFYGAANLVYNPFRTNPTVEADPRKGVWVGYENEQETLVKFITRSRADQVANINFLMIYGEYGTGKSHSLLWAEHYITQKAKDEFNSLVFYIPTLKKSKGVMSFQGAFIEDIVNKTNIVKELSMFKLFLEDCATRYRTDKGLGLEITRDSILEQLLPSVDLSNLAKEIIRCENGDAVSDILSPKNDYQALLLFTRLTNLFVFDYKLPSGNKRFKSAVYLFIDELDQLQTVTAKEAREVNDLIRHIYDLCPYCFCMALAFTATTAELPTMFTEYVLGRVSRQIVLDFLQPDEAKVFIKSILDTARIDNTQNNGYYPFSEDAASVIVSQIVSITPRKIVNRMQQIIEEARLAGIDPGKTLITPQVLDENNIWEAVA